LAQSEEKAADSEELPKDEKPEDFGTGAKMIEPAAENEEAPVASTGKKGGLLGKKKASKPKVPPVDEPGDAGEMIRTAAKGDKSTKAPSINAAAKPKVLPKGATLEDAGEEPANADVSQDAAVVPPSKKRASGTPKMTPVDEELGHDANLTESAADPKKFKKARQAYIDALVKKASKAQKGTKNKASTSGDEQHGDGEHDEQLGGQAPAEKVTFACRTRPETEKGKLLWDALKSTFAAVIKGNTPFPRRSKHEA
jgi:hypothetical protein